MTTRAHTGPCPNCDDARHRDPRTILIYCGGCETFVCGECFAEHEYPEETECHYAKVKEEHAVSLKDIASTTADQIQAEADAKNAAVRAAQARRKAMEAEFLNRIRELDGLEIATSDRGGQYIKFAAPTDLTYSYLLPYLRIEAHDGTIRFVRTGEYGYQVSFHDYTSTEEAAREFAALLGPYIAHAKVQRAAGRQLQTNVDIRGGSVLR